MKRTKYPEEYQGGTERKKRFRPRRFKDRPGDVDGLVSALTTGRLDQRTLQARQILTLREAIESAPLEHARALVADVLAVNAVLLQELTAATTRIGVHLVDADGTPHPILTKHIPGVQRAILQASACLERLEGLGPEKGKTSTTAKSKRNPAPSEGGDVSALVLELTKGGRQ